ncbi:MAG: response regulator [Xanthomonadales bacterium]|jgi:twitching motility two-component system response regulator PilH|nr:response regulator [Xanthomonadales bacterium]
MSKVLIVDDSHSQLYYLRKMVEQGGHCAVTVDSGEKALEAARQERPAVILMDIVMPGMSGYTTTRKLGKTRSTSNIPVIFVTSRDSEADRTWGLRQGAREYVTKPVNANLLLTAISEAIAA